MGRKLTLRGFLASGGRGVLLDYEGINLTVGWKVISASSVGISDPSALNKGMILHTDAEKKTALTFADNQVIGWCGTTYGKSEIIDPNHVIVNTLYASSLSTITYVIVIEQVTIDPLENVIYQLKERAQSSLEPFVPGP